MRAWWLLALALLAGCDRPPMPRTDEGRGTEAVEAEEVTGRTSPESAGRR